MSGTQKITAAAALLLLCAFIVMAAIKSSSGKEQEKCNREWEGKLSGYRGSDKAPATVWRTDTREALQFFFY